MLGSRAAVAQGWKLGWVFRPWDEQGVGGGFALVDCHFQCGPHPQALSQYSAVQLTSSSRRDFFGRIFHKLSTVRVFGWLQHCFLSSEK